MIASQRFLRRVLLEMELRQLTPVRFCEGADVPRSTFESWKRDHCAPTIDVAERVARYFGETLGEFLGDVPPDHGVTECARRSYEAIRNTAMQSSPDQRKTAPRSPARRPA